VAAAADTVERGYGELARHPAVGLVAILPIFAVYEATSRWLLTGQRNAAEWAMMQTFALLGESGWNLIRLLTLTMVLVSLAVVGRGGRSWWRACGWVSLEGSLYGLGLGHAAVFLASGGALGAIAGNSLGRDLVLALGAGLYEEILFRLFLLSLLVFVLGWVCEAIGLARWFGQVLAVLGSAAVFALFHHLGAGAEPIALWPLMFRSAAGVLLGGLFMLRGFGVVVYCHAIYDVCYFVQHHLA
jgi:membrane protease YdiL (CAAX protease family)